MHSEFVSEFIVQSNHDTSTLEITFSSTQNLYCSYHRIKNCPTLEIGVQCIQNLHVNSQYGQIMTTLPQILLFAVHRNIIRYFHFGPMDHGSVLVKFQAERNFFEITRTIHSNSERSEQLLITEWFFLLVLKGLSYLLYTPEQKWTGNKHRAWKICQKE